jgi:hypothetical protein
MRGAAELRSMRNVWCDAAEAAFSVEAQWRSQGTTAPCSGSQRKCALTFASRMVTIWPKSQCWNPNRRGFDHQLWSGLPLSVSPAGIGKVQKTQGTLSLFRSKTSYVRVQCYFPRTQPAAGKGKGER